MRLPPVQERLTAWVQEAVGSRVSFASVRLRFLPPGLEVLDLVPGVALPAGSVAKIQSLGVSLDLGDLLGGRIAVAKIDVAGLDLAARRSANGEIPLVDVLEALVGEGDAGDRDTSSLLDDDLDLRVVGRMRLLDEASASADTPIDLAAGFDLSASISPGRGLRYALEGRVAERGRFSAHGRLGEGTTLADRSFELVLQARSLPAAQVLPYLLPGDPIANAKAQVSGTLSWQGDRADEVEGPVHATLTEGGFDWLGLGFAAPIDFSSTLKLSRGALSLPDARATVAAIQLGALPFQNASARFSWQVPELRFAGLDVTVAEGTLHYAGDARLPVDGVPEYAGAITLQGVAFPALVRDLTGNEDRTWETLAARAEFHGAVRDGEPWQQQIEGHGSVEMRGGEVPVVAVLGPIFDALTMHRREHPESAAMTRNISMSETFRIHDGELTTTDLAIETSDYTLHGRGSLSLEGALDYRLECKLTQSGVRALLSLAREAGREGKSSALPALPIRVHGHVSDFAVSPDFGGVSLMPFRLLLFGAKGAAELLLDVGESGTEMLNDGARRGRDPSR